MFLSNVLIIFSIDFSRLRTLYARSVCKPNENMFQQHHKPCFVPPPLWSCITWLIVTAVAVAVAPAAPAGAVATLSHYMLTMVSLMMSAHSSSCCSLMTSGGASLMMSP